MNHFFALPLPPAVRDHLAQLAAQWRRTLPPTVEARWHEEGDHHITLKFLGDVPPELARDLLPVAQRVAEQTEPFPLCLVPCGGFPDLNKPFVLWAGVGASEPLSHLAAALDKAMRTHGFAGEDRPYCPHVTLARCRTRHGGPGLQAPDTDEQAFPIWDAGSLALMQTSPPEQRRNGLDSRYNIVHLFPFGTTPSSAE